MDDVDENVDERTANEGGDTTSASVPDPATVTQSTTTADDGQTVRQTSQLSEKAADELLRQHDAAVGAVSDMSSVSTPSTVARDEQWRDVNVVGPVTAIVATMTIDDAQEEVPSPIVDVASDDTHGPAADVIIEDVAASDNVAAPVHDEGAPVASAVTVAVANVDEVIEAVVTRAEATVSTTAPVVLCIDDIISTTAGPTGPPVAPTGQPGGPTAPEIAPDVIDLTNTVDVAAPITRTDDTPTVAAPARPASPSMSMSSYVTAVVTDAIPIAAAAVALVTAAGDASSAAARDRPASPETSTTSDSYRSALTQATDERRWVRAFDFSSRPTDSVVGRPIFPELDLAQRMIRFDVAPRPPSDEVVERWLAEMPPQPRRSIRHRRRHRRRRRST